MADRHHRLKDKDRHTDRQTSKKKDRQRHTNRHTQEQKDTLTNIKRHTDTNNEQNKCTDTQDTMSDRQARRKK